ncbi:hypothetical protein E4T47_02782 [Aureobasidium subglaciale]|nr:hypothetical protein E4T47_02782 [Aureobasidium subglaciale]
MHIDQPRDGLEWHGSLPMEHLASLRIWLLYRFALSASIRSCVRSTGARVGLPWVTRNIGTDSIILASQSGNISTAFSAGLTAGAFTWGVLVDIIGWYSGH